MQYDTIGTQTLTVTSNGTWNNAPTSYTYQWQRNSVNISGATSNSYNLQQADVGSSLRVTVVATNSYGSSSAIASTAIGPIVSKPINTVAPVVTGTPTQGQVLNVNTGTWVGGVTSYTYQWYYDNNTDQVGGTSISGATTNSLTVPATAVGSYVYCRVTATNAQGVTNSPTNSNNVGPVAATGGGTYAITTPTIDLTNATVGDAAPLWSVNFVNPAPTGADIGDTIQCRYGTSSAAAQAAAPVSEILDEGELIDGDALFPEFDTWAASQTVGTTLYWQVRVVRTPGSVESDWSTMASFVIADGVANTVAFTDATGAALSTLTWSNAITIAGLGAGASSRFTVEAGGQLRVNGGTGTTAEVLVQNGDTLAVAVTSSALSGNTTSKEVYQRGVLYDTFSVTTSGAAALDIALQDVQFSTSAIATYTFTAMGIGSADATRIVLLQVGSRKGTGGNAIPTSVTIGGVTATMVSGVQADDGSTANVSATIWKAAVPTGTTADVVITHAASMSRCSARTQRMVNGNSTAASSGTQNSITSGTTLTVTPTIPSGDILIAHVVAHVTGGGATWSGATEEFDGYLSGTNLTVFSGAKSSTAGSPTVIATTSSSSSRALAWAVFGT